MNGALVVVLVLAWALVLLPGALRSRRSSPHATVGGFERAMAVLRNRPPGRELMIPGDAARIVQRDEDGIGLLSSVRRAGRRSGDGSPSADADAAAAPAGRTDPLLARRRRILVRTAASAGIALLLALVVGGFMWTVALVSVAALGGYVALLRRWKLQRDEAREVVRMLRTTQRRHEAETAAPMARAVGEVPQTLEGWGGLQVATAVDEPWERGAGVRIRRWGD